MNAAIVRGDEILMIEFRDESGAHFNLPGGGLDPGESVEEGLKRECREEASVDVRVERLLLVWEYVPEKENFKYGNRQKVGLVFLCRIDGHAIAALPTKPDKNQVGVKWVKLDELEKLPTAVRPPLLPAIEKPLLEAIKNNSGPSRVWSE